MKKTQLTKFAFYQDSESQNLGSYMTRYSIELSVQETTGTFATECLMAYLQIFPRKYGKVVGLSESDWRSVFEVYHIGSRYQSFAEGAIGDHAFQSLIAQGFLRESIGDDGEKVYFPTKSYLRKCGLIKD